MAADGVSGEWGDHFAVIGELMRRPSRRPAQDTSAAIEDRGSSTAMCGLTKIIRP
jgi:hypothetical protein